MTCYSRRAVLAVVLDLPDETPETICHHLAMPPGQVIQALDECRRADLARPYRALLRTTRPGSAVLEDVEDLVRAREGTAQICRRLGMSPGAIYRALARQGRPELARPFGDLHERERKASR